MCETVNTNTVYDSLGLVWLKFLKVFFFLENKKNKESMKKIFGYHQNDVFCIFKNSFKK